MNKIQKKQMLQTISNTLRQKLELYIKMLTEGEYGISVPLFDISTSPFTREGQNYQFQYIRDSLLKDSNISITITRIGDVIIATKITPEQHEAKKLGSYKNRPKLPKYEPIRTNTPIIAAYRNDIRQLEVNQEYPFHVAFKGNVSGICSDLKRKTGRVLTLLRANPNTPDERIVRRIC
jgi:hypothetical protein